MRPQGTALPERVREAACALADGGGVPAYIYDLEHLAGHLARIRSAFDQAGGGIEILHAVKANPDPRLLAVIGAHVDGLEVASGGELAHVRSHLPGVPLAFGGPGKTDVELAAALDAGVHRFHVESLHELRRLDLFARAAGTVAPVLLRVNIPSGTAGDGVAALTMGGVPSPFGMDPAEAEKAAVELAQLPGVELFGIHAHLASGHGPAGCVALASSVLDWAAAFAARHGLDVREVNVGGGMDVDYADPDRVFDWDEYARLLAPLAEAYTPLTVRIEPGRAISAYSGWYATQVLDLKRSHGKVFAVCAGGTHHLRTPAAKGHSQPLAVVPRHGWGRPWPRPSETGTEVTFVGQLCTPKDVLARDITVPRLAVGDVVVFGMAGAYAYNISHRDFLMHPAPAVVHLERTV
ncbi:type III PLP-dependent enzyme [Arthrobacter sp. H5]|uniref:type III PLP-dependent enzyme n=1 Tax=Arthrobacter sp. H5 TaxID=1267973 RepID=UPI0004842561|nr:type III PLP-dependent enzyme [Arthrobacter sp. H5]